MSELIGNMPESNLQDHKSGTGLHAQHRRQTAIRGIVATILVALLALAFAGGSIIQLSQTPSSFVPSFSVSPTASDSSTWYCAIPDLSSLPGVSVALTLVNVSKFRQHATITVASALGKRTSTLVSLNPGSTDAVAGKFANAGKVGVTVDFSGGGDFAAYSISGQNTQAQGFCQPSPGPTWTVQALSTLGSSDGVISIYNPFSTDSIIDINLISPGGVQAPAPLQAVVVGAYQSISVDLSDWVQNQPTIGMSIQTRLGRVVPGGIEMRSDTKANGVSAAVISPEIFSSYTFPLLGQSINQSVSIDLYNYSPNQANVEITLQELKGSVASTLIDKGKANDLVSSFAETVPGNSSLSIPLKSIASVPVGAFFSMVVRDTGFVLPVVTLVGSAVGPSGGYFTESGQGASWPSWLSVLFANPGATELNKLAVVYVSSRPGAPALLERDFLNGTKAQLGPDSIDAQAGLAISGSRTAVDVFPTVDPGGFPSTFVLRSSSYAMVGIAFVQADGSLVPVDTIATD